MNDNDFRVAVWLLAEARWERDQLQARNWGWWVDLMAERDEARHERDTEKRRADGWEAQMVTCHVCHGAGSAPANRRQACTWCSGSGLEVPRHLPDPDAADPAHLRWAADFIEAANLNTGRSPLAPRLPVSLRSDADRLEAEAVARSRRDTLIEKALDHAIAVIKPGATPTNLDRRATAAIVDAVLAEVADD